MRFISDKGYYEVTCPDESLPEVRAFVTQVEAMIPTLVQTFGLEVRYPFPPHKHLEVFFLVSNKEGGGYEAGGIITLKSPRFPAPFQELEYKCGGLFHETTHAILQGYGRDQHNCMLESMAVILQVESLKHVPNQPEGSKGAESYNDWGYDPSLDEHMWKCYRQQGFDPFRRIIAELGQHCCILRKGQFRQDWNKLCTSLSLDLHFR